MSNFYIQIQEYESVDGKALTDFLDNSGYKYNTTFEPLEFVCDELTEVYIENCVEEELKPLFINAKEDLSKWLYEEVNDVIDGNLVIDILNEYPIEDIEKLYEEKENEE